MKLPYPWFGGKTRVAALVWERFGDVKNYVEPFLGGGAVLLNRPTEHKHSVETVNDINAWLCNFWRAAKHDPDKVAYYASDPVNEIDLHARGDWLFYRPDALEFVERLRSDPTYYCTQSAGWWVWGQCSWIGTGWGRGEKRVGKGVGRKLPHLGNAGMGVGRKLPHLGDAGRGINRRHTGTRLDGITRYIHEVRRRIEDVRVCCGDWSRVCGPAVTIHRGLTGVFLDPPYASKDRRACYSDDDSFAVAHDARVWALEHGHEMRIALCGYEGEHDMPGDWDTVEWRTHGGYGNQGAKQGRANKARERIYFSPACLRVEADAASKQECLPMEK